ncbi:hypothetical protein I5M27_07220 [Adhaeribacter sp. BT258]|uniref:Uncharacterized protein n=1 Tax=Adhaeribacter terrigena TaxID=2793070 RepID=A0ABS1C0S6_9BACT|nr:hypothetical protein [Adhaeribacter terrigena]MBK0402771.1 hypothetical protein [Adhaeribacter terrigena]
MKTKEAAAFICFAACFGSWIGELKPDFACAFIAKQLRISVLGYNALTEAWFKS